MPCTGNALKPDTKYCALSLVLILRFLTCKAVPYKYIRVPEGFNVDLYSDKVPGARYLTVSKLQRPPTSLAYVGTNTSEVYALLDSQGNGQPQTLRILRNLTQPSSVAWYNGTLFVAEPNRLLRFDGADDCVLSGKPLPAPVVVLSPIAPLDPNSKVIGFGPDGRLYVSINAACTSTGCSCGGQVTPGNNLLTYCSIAYLLPNGTDFRSEITGIRKTGGLTFDPSSTAPFIAYTSQMPDDAAYRNFDDLFYYQFVYALTDLGTPLCQWTGKGSPVVRSIGPGNVTADSNLTVTSLRNNPAGTPEARNAYCQGNITKPSQALGPQVGATGTRFYTGAQQGYNTGVQFPKRFVNFTAFVAEHGSLTNPQRPGFRVAAVRLTNGNGTSTSHVNFASGWLINGVPWGRPVDVQPLLDGSLLISDDLAGAVYRVTYNRSTIPDGI
ncbi:Uncharacterized protein BB_0024 at C-terminar half [Coccomyxa sp. Obi]|nr:Uncharacterized protein BB_0024 at C-terminar half [Coccomyxa sp. Obi]